MSFGDEGGAWIKIIAMGAIGTLLCGMLLFSCESPGQADEHVSQILKKKGYTEIKLHGSYTRVGLGGWPCGEDDYHMVEFKAINNAGQEEDGFVCCGRMDPLVSYSKGCTIRN